MPVPSRSFLVSILLLLIADLAWAGPVTGRVVDPDGRAVRGATVLLVDGASVVATTLTDEAGAFTIAAPHDGPFEILASVDGLRARPVSVRGDGNVGEIKLEVSAVRESVVVSAAQVEVPLSTTSSSVTILTEDDLASLQVRDLPEALRMVPGLSIVSAGGYGAQTSAFPRGGESDYSMVFIDGVQANAFGGGFDFAHVPMMNVERIEIVRGPQSALYGSNAIGSVIRIVSKRGGAPTASALVEGGSFGTSRFGGAASQGVGPWQWGASVDRMASDGVVENDDYERLTLAGGVGWSRQNGPGVRADVNYTDDERGFPGPYGSDPGGTFSGIDTVARGSNERWLASVSGVVPAGTRVRLHGQLAYTSIDGTQVSSFDPETSLLQYVAAHARTRPGRHHVPAIAAGHRWRRAAVRTRRKLVHPRQLGRGRGRTYASAPHSERSGGTADRRCSSLAVCVWIASRARIWRATPAASRHGRISRTMS